MSAWKWSEFNDTISLKNPELTSFERLFVICMLAFRDAGVKYGVVECGMGGLLDATNAIDYSDKELCIICSIDLDHQVYLGDTLQKIAKHKAGIVGPGNTCIVSESACKAGILDFIPESAGTIVVSPFDCVLFDGYVFEEGDLFPTGTSYFIKDLNLKVKVPGLIGHSSFALNAGLAVKALIQLDFLTLDYKLGFSSFEHRGRGNVVTLEGSRRFLLDGCHNQESVASLCNWLPPLLKSHNPICLVVGFSKGIEDAKSMLKVLIHEISPRLIRKLYICQFSTPEGMPWIRSLSGELIRQEMSSFFASLSIDVDYIDSIDNITSDIDECKESLTLVCGSLYLLSDFYANFLINKI